MSALPRNWAASAVAWSLHRNPLYLLSAVCMAVGARLFLVRPETRAGDIGVILLTLGVLQLYKWTVMGVLLLLHRSRRSPEDEPALLLVQTLFWTGPLAATIEMSARYPHFGGLLALAVGLFALVELRIVHLAIQARFSSAAYWAPVACLAVLIGAPPQLSAGAGAANELFLYFCWWALGAIALLAMLCNRKHAPALPLRRLNLPYRREMAFITLVIGATAFHLYAMNYAFMGHARLFYAAPLLCAAGAVGFDFVARLRLRPQALAATAALFPLVGVAISIQPFHPDTPFEMLPTFLRDPLQIALLAAMITWWFGALRLRSAFLLHMGTASLAALVFGGHVPWPIDPLQPQWGAAVALAPREVLTLLVGGVIAYLLLVAVLRRRRVEAFVALLLAQAAVLALLAERPEWAAVGAPLSLSWTALVGMHLIERRPRVGVLFAALCVMVFASWRHEFTDLPPWPIRISTLAAFVALLVAARARPRQRYGCLATFFGVSNAAFYAAFLLATSNLSPAVLVTGSGFALLIAGAGVSWYKRDLFREAHLPLHVESMDVRELEP